MKRIAIIGSGVSGMVSAYLLKQKYDITLFEKNDYLGGHTATVEVELDDETYNIDTGFIVFNDKTYPNFIKLLNKIGVAKQPTEMSFSVRNALTGLEYNGHNLNTLFSQRKNIFSLSFLRLIKQILKFNRLCKSLYEQDNIEKHVTLGDFLNQHKFTEFFSQHYILPMGAAIWSSSLEQMKDFPLKFFIQFFYNHGLLNIADRPQWYVIKGGSKSYIPKLMAGLEDKIQLNSQITSVKRQQNQVIVSFENQPDQVFDEVILACHSDQALNLLADVTPDEQRILGDITYSANKVVLHTDTKMLPKNKRSWASWNYLLDDNWQRPAAVTYNMNILMGLNVPHTFSVTLNQTEQIDSDKILKSFVYHHPVFNHMSFAAQQQRQQICGVNQTHFAGAYWYNGFHEDGVRSAIDVARRLGVEFE